jgi:hypothetical protein
MQYKKCKKVRIFFLGEVKKNKGRVWVICQTKIMTLSYGIFVPDWINAKINLYKTKRKKEKEKESKVLQKNKTK